MNRIDVRFRDLKTVKRKALIPYLTAGDPAPGHTVGIMHTLVEAGADIIELGVPFSDPMADGPVIQAACERALVHNTSLGDVLNMVVEFRKKDDKTPVVLMGYLNPVEAMGYEDFSKRAAAAGVDGVLTVDMPPEEGTDLVRALESRNIHPIFLLAPNSTDRRIEKIVGMAKGFVYYVSLKGVTGVKSLVVNEVDAKLKVIRKFTDLPIGVGFGINDAESAASVAKISDAVVVGSAIIKRIEQHASEPQKINVVLKDFVSGLRSAIDA